MHHLPGSLRRRTAAVAATLAVGLGGLAFVPAPAGAGTAADAAVALPGATWQVDSPESQGMDAATLAQARDYAFAPGRNTQGVVVVRDGVIVGEWYADGAGPDSWAASWSVAKSFISSLIGIAIAEGKIPSVDVPMSTYYPDWVGTPKEAITLRHVLRMESGLDWDEDYDPTALAESEVIQMGAASPDQLAYAASRPAEVPPGTRWSYSSGDSMLLSGVIQQATGMSAEAYGRQKLFDPIQFEKVEWWRDAAGHTLTYCCFDTPSRGFARFGLLYLNGGRWGDQQIVPESWVQDSMAFTALSGGIYGYQWWGTTVDGVPVWMANGHDGQFIHIIPSLDLVVVRNGDYVKDPCEPVADPNLFGRYPPSGLVEGKGTRPPASWSVAAFIRPILQSVQADVVPPDAFTPPTWAPQVDPRTTCPTDPPPAPPATVAPAVVVTPRFTA